MELSKILRGNRNLEENIKIIREENEQYQEEIFELDIRGDNLKKYGY